MTERSFVVLYYPRRSKYGTNLVKCFDNGSLFPLLIVGLVHTSSHGKQHPEAHPTSLIMPQILPSKVVDSQPDLHQFTVEQNHRIGFRK